MFLRPEPKVRLCPPDSRKGRVPQTRPQGLRGKVQSSRVLTPTHPLALLWGAGDFNSWGRAWGEGPAAIGSQP